jgi:alkanesulfonate monooxygenase SsuD/methylene tetrahydromethanopterin reductase-like flavin-dependent oxidoreductase (luciferase family)
MKFGVFYNPMVMKAPGATDWEPGLEKQKFREMLEQIEFADSLGFEYAFLGEHHFAAEYAHNSAPEVILGALARSTKNIRIGTGITHMSHNDPVRTAERLATVDVISDGRLEWGFGPGSASEVAPFLKDGGESKGVRSMTNAQITIDIMRSRGVYPGADTQYYDISPVNVVPKVVQTPHPPLWMSTIQVPQSAEVARRGLGNMILAAAGAEEVGQAIELYWDTLLGGGLEVMGAGVNPAVFTFAAGIVAPTDELARERAEEGLGIFGFGLSGAAMLGQADPDANLTDWYYQRRAGGVDVREQMGFPPGFLAMGDAYPVLPGNLLNSPESTKVKLRQLEAVHTDGVLLNQQFGNTKHEHIMESLELFAKEVAPEFREREPLHQEWRAKKLAGATFNQVTSL